MARRFFLLLVVFWAASRILVGAQKIMWYNVENVFDTQHDSLKNDWDFLPEGSYHWTPWRYWRKLDNISRVIAAVAEQGGWPMMVGMCEVENDTVLRDLTLRSPLRAAKYSYVHTEGPDLRGVDCCLLYQPSLFRLQGIESITVPSAEYGLRPTRDILHVWGHLTRTDSLLHVFMLHFPSRAGDSKSSTQNRMLAAETLCMALDKLQGQRVLVMGDFNAALGDRVFRDVPLRTTDDARAQGTYSFRGFWQWLDHVLVSESVVTRQAARPVELPWLLEENMTYGGKMPRRTFRGPTYHGGISDHLPVVLDMWFE